MQRLRYEYRFIYHKGKPFLYADILYNLLFSVDVLEIYMYNK